jgi:DNA segregation ATPase FtsK/SpoIIIE, S-DNA-T family
VAKKKEKETYVGMRSLKEETLHTIYSVLFLVIAIVLFLAALNKAGPVGNKLFQFLTELFGIGYFLLPLILIVLSVIFIRSLQRPVGALKIIASGLLFFALLGITNLISTGKGGIVGNIISYPLVKLFENTASYIILGTLIIVSSLVIIDTRPRLPSLNLWKKKEVGGDEDVNIIMPKTADKKMVGEAEEEDEEADIEVEDKVRQPTGGNKPEKAGFVLAPRLTLSHKKFVPPPISLLEYDKGKPGVGDIKANANIIKRTLQNFGINVEMDEISIGPSVTRYALKPAEGVKLSKIVTLQNDLSLALAAHPIRIEAPIPGKSLVGIEIPNNTKTTVGLASLLSESEYQDSNKPLLVSLGRGISGKSYFANLAKAPHLLIAGATGSGKSVTIHAILTSLLYRNSPENLKFIMIDPKRVELTLYNKIPHLLTPVITDAKKTILALKWAAKEMDRRYDVLQSLSVRDIESYHKNILEPAIKKLESNKDEETEAPELMPYIVIVIDELADIMQSYPRELESAIVRLAQMSRAVGIHLILSTQRPSVNVITGLIKANVPSRIALQVTSQIDSRTILDTGGAEKLLGAGDMLFMSGDMSKPQRIQSSFITETELKKVVKYFTDNYDTEIPADITVAAEGQDKNSIFESSFGDDNDDDDELYEEARDIVMKAGKASTSYIQRKLRVGYARAARLIDMLEERGVVSPGEGSKPRDVIGASASGGGDDDTESIDQ